MLDSDVLAFAEGQLESAWGAGAPGLWCQLLGPLGCLCHPLEWVGISAPVTGVGTMCPLRNSYWGVQCAWGAQHQWLERDHGSQPMCLVLFAGGATVCNCPKLCVHGVSLTSKPQAGPAREQGTLGLGRGVRQGGGLCWYLGGPTRTRCLWDERECPCACSKHRAGQASGWETCQGGKRASECRLIEHADGKAAAASLGLGWRPLAHWAGLQHPGEGIPGPQAAGDGSHLSLSKHLCTL